LVASFALGAFAADIKDIRDQILAAYQRSIDALRRGDVNGALAIDADD